MEEELYLAQEVNIGEDKDLHPVQILEMFRIERNGTIVEGTTDDIVRGYKDGYDIQQTGGGPEVTSDNTTFF